MANGVKARNGEPMAYLLAHMHDGCCYPWPYAKQSAGYPHLLVKGKTQLASRLVCAMNNGEAPNDESVARHKCGKGHLGCFNADCLHWGTDKENTHDAIAHGTLARGEKVGTSKLKYYEVEQIKNLLGKLPQSKIAKMFGVSQSMVCKINKGVAWK